MNKLILFCSQFAFPLQKINNAVFKAVSYTHLTLPTIA